MIQKCAAEPGDTDVKASVGVIFAERMHTSLMASFIAVDVYRSDMSMLKPVCVPCQRFFRMKKQGFYFIEAMPIGNQAKPGTEEPEKWTPYKIWASDQWECGGCGAVILSGFGQSPIAEHYQPDFSNRATSLGATQLQVNDC